MQRSTCDLVVKASAS